MDVKKCKEILELITMVLPDTELISRMYGIIHKQIPAEINGVRGFLIWDYIIYNEITFKDVDGNIYSLFKSDSDPETEKKWDELEKKYGVVNALI